MVGEKFKSRDGKPMKSVVIVTASRRAPGVMALRQSFTDLSCAVEIALLDGVESTGRVIDRADEVVFRIKPKTVDIYRDTLLPLLQNKRHAKLLVRVLEAFDKGSQAIKLTDGGIPMPMTRVVRSLPELATWLPCVLKNPSGNKGDGVFLVDNNLDMIEVTNQILSSQAKCIQQEYIHVHPASDKRLFVAGDEVIASMKRVAVGDSFRSNLHQGGSGEVYTPSNKERRIAVLSAKSLGLPFCGVDIIDSPRGPLVLEVNPSPGFAIAEITGVPVADIVAKYYIDRR